MTDPLAPRILRKFLAEQEPVGECEMQAAPEEEHLAVAPPGWEGPVKEMKKDKDIDNPWALAWHMKNKGDKPHKKEATLAERVASRFMNQSLAERVATRHAQALEDAAAKKKVKLPEVAKLEDIMVKLPFAVKVLDQKRGDRPTEHEVSRLMGEYTDYVAKLRKALDSTLPKDAGHERQKADELLNKIDFFRFGRGTEAHVLDGSLPAAKFEEEFKKVKPIFHELEQLLKGQMVMFASADVDLKPAEAEASKGHARFEDNKKQHAEMKALLKKVENADPSAKKKFDKAYDKMFANGEAAAKAAQHLLSKYEDVEGPGEAAVRMLDSTLRAWHHNKMDHIKGSSAFAGQKMHAANNTYGYAQDLESYVKDFAKMLKDPHHKVDESWRGH